MAQTTRLAPFGPVVVVVAISVVVVTVLVVVAVVVWCSIYFKKILIT
jgi:hypothetical protein